MARHGLTPFETGSGPNGWAFAATPCGVSLLGALDWAMGTPVWAVLEGLCSTAPAVGGSIEWTATAIGRDILDRVLAGERPTYGPGHSESGCGALHCRHGRGSQ